MRKIPFIAIACAASSLYGHDYYCPSNDIVLFADYAYLTRGEIRDFPLVKNTRVLTDAKTLLDTEDLVEAMGSESALKVGILWDHNLCNSFELFYTYVRPWHSKKTLNNAGLLSYAFKDFRTILNGFFGADTVVAKYSSQLQNGEFNYWIHVTPQYVDYFSFSLDLGLRYISLQEHFSLRFLFPAAESHYAVKTNNHLYGAQLGAVLEINPTDCWTWSFMVKTAAFANKANDHIQITDPFDVNAPPNKSKHKLVSTGLVEGYVQLAYHASSFLSLHVGYDGFLLFGLALAPEQRALNNSLTTTLRANGQIVVHGFYTGLSIRF
ncbi:MAG: hypothetical protein JSS30_01920 [Verrucomicrobia bacterium]|nr:hypothetical protein [Verrucomicrobiota bacterium]